jgi:hypothetical protein
MLLLLLLLLLPLLLQEELCQAAIAAGIPEKLVYGDISKHELPRLVSAMHVSWGGG